MLLLFWFGLCLLVVRLAVVFPLALVALPVPAAIVPLPAVLLVLAPASVARDLAREAGLDTTRSLLGTLSPMSLISATISAALGTSCLDATLIGSIIEVANSVLEGALGDSWTEGALKVSCLEGALDFSRVTVMVSCLDGALDSTREAALETGLLHTVAPD